MDNTLLGGIISGSIGVIGLAIGYLFREYQNRVKNFIHVYNIESDMTKYHDTVEVSDELVEICKKSELLDNLKKNEKYRNVYDNWDIADDLKRFWGKIKENISSLNQTNDEKEFVDILQLLFNNKYFEKYIRRFYLKNKADDIITKLKEIKINISEVDDDGDVYIGFPEEDISFETTKHPAGIAKFKIFLNNISTLDIANIKEILSRFITFMDREYDLCISAYDSFLQIKNHQSRWAFYVQIANISSNPFLLELEPKLKIRHKKNIYVVDLYTTIFKKDTRTNEDYIADISKPILFKRSESNELIVISKNSEKDIEFGKTIREIFESKKGTYRIEWRVIKPGLLKRKVLRTTYKPFYN